MYFDFFAYNEYLQRPEDPQYTVNCEKFQNCTTYHAPTITLAHAHGYFTYLKTVPFRRNLYRRFPLGARSILVPTIVSRLEPSVASGTVVACGYR